MNDPDAAMVVVFLMGIPVLLGLIPAKIASRKGRSFGLWWLYGTLLFLIALVHALLAEDLRRLPCPRCAERIYPEAEICPHCHTSVDWSSRPDAQRLGSWESRSLPGSDVDEGSAHPSIQRDHDNDCWVADIEEDIAVWDRDSFELERETGQVVTVDLREVTSVVVDDAVQPLQLVFHREEADDLAVHVRGGRETKPLLTAIATMIDRDLPPRPAAAVDGGGLPPEIRANQLAGASVRYSPELECWTAMLGGGTAVWDEEAVEVEGLRPSPITISRSELAGLRVDADTESCRLVFLQRNGNLTQVALDPLAVQQATEVADALESWISDSEAVPGLGGPGAGPQGEM